MSTIDHAPVIAAFLSEPRWAAAPDDEVYAAVTRRWPAATDDELRRAARIACECAEADLAELYAESAAAAYDRIEPGRRARMAEGVASILCGVASLAELTAALAAIYARWLHLPVRVLVEGPAAAENLQPRGMGEA